MLFMKELNRLCLSDFNLSQGIGTVAFNTLATALIYTAHYAPLVRGAFLLMPYYFFIKIFLLCFIIGVIDN